MSQQTSGLPPAAPAGGTPTTQVARDEASEVGRTTAEAGKHVVGTAKEQAGQVTQEARRQAKDLLQEARGQAAQQARTGQQKATQGLRALASELHQMADGGEQHGPASDLAKQAASRVEDFAAWIDTREPGDLLHEVRGVARRRPGAFLLGAALAGVLAGRLTRGAVDANRDTGPSGGYPSPRQPVGYPAAPSPVPYDAAAETDVLSDRPLGGPGIPPTTAPRPYAPAPDPYATGAAGVGGTGQHALRPGASTVGEYVQDMERGDLPPEDRPYQGGSR